MSTLYKYKRHLIGLYAELLLADGELVGSTLGLVTIVTIAEWRKILQTEQLLTHEKSCCFSSNTSPLLEGNDSPSKKQFMFSLDKFD